MDKQFLEFWGNVLLQAAKGQAQVENIGKWLDQGASGVQNLTDQFRRTYNLASEKTPTADQQTALQQATDRFNKAYEDYLALLSVVPEARYRELESKNESLQKEVARLQQEIARLRGAPEGAGEPADETIADFHALVEKQQRDFEDLTRQFKRFWDKQPDSQGSKTPAKKT
jgi:predicted  nucleic acid-binding Zn-ribbon protein